jgi:23S rRNA (guanosine2251-2'-O)-methyltransferase
LRAQLIQHGIQTAPIKEQHGVAKDAAHQGLIAVINPAKLIMPLEVLISKLDIKRKPCIVLLDEIQDPHNLGAIVRSAAAFGAAGVVLPVGKQAPISGAAVKASVGTIFSIPIAFTESTDVALKALKHRGFRAYALAMKGARDVTKEPFDAPTVIVVGNEGSGIRQHTLAHCDVNLRIPMHHRVESLNAAVSASTALYEWSRQHPEWLK